jgi:hypothetical protein
MAQSKKAPTSNVVDIKTKELIQPKTGGPDQEETVDPLFWAYLAGIIDADGTIVWNVTPRKNQKRGPVKLNRTARISVTMCDLDILENIVYMTGLGAVYLERLKGVNGGNRHVYRWSIQSRADLMHVIPLIYSFMGYRKGAKLIELQTLIRHWDALALDKAELKAAAK